MRILLLLVALALPACSARRPPITFDPVAPSSRPLRAIEIARIKKAAEAGLELRLEWDKGGCVVTAGDALIASTALPLCGSLWTVALMEWAKYREGRGDGDE